MHKQIILKNGLKVLLVPIAGVKSLTVMKMYDVGSRHETPQDAGMAHFLEHMMFKGTQRRPTAQDISVELDSVGAQFNAFTSKDYTGYYVKVAAEKFELAVDILADMLYNSKFESSELEKEKGVIIEEMKVYEDQPSHQVDDLYEELVFAGNTLADKIVGSRETIRAATRERMAAFHDQYYHDHNSILCVAGAVPENAEEILNQYWNRPANAIEKNGKNYERCVVAQTEPRIKVFKKKVEQANLELGFVSEGFVSDDVFVYLLICTIMGGGMSSRLFEELREKRGLCYYVRMSSDLYEDAGTLAVKAGLNHEKLEEAIIVILDELKKLKDVQVSEKELQKSKDFIIGNLILDQEDSASVAELYLRQYVITGTLITPDEKIQKLKAVTVEDIQRVAKKIFVEAGMNLALVASEPQEENYKKILKI